MASGSHNKLGVVQGEAWTYQIFFDPEADHSTGDCYYIKDHELHGELLHILHSTDENINKVYAYKHPLSEWQLTDFYLHHMLIIFETDNWWWSIEKNGEGLTIQRSKYKQSVLERYRQTKRTSGIKKVESDKGRISLFDLVSWLYQSNELNLEYNVLTSNCQHFAKNVFDYAAKKKNLKIAT